MKETLKFLRLQNGFSQNKVAEYLGISRQMYMKYESGETEPTVKCIRELSRLYNVTYDILIDDKYKSETSSNSYSDTSDGTLELHSSAPAYTASNVSVDSLNYRQTLRYLFKLNREDLIRIATKALRVEEEKKQADKPETPEMSQEEKERLFHKFSGYIKDVQIEDARAEYLKYLDEKYSEYLK